MKKTENRESSESNPIAKTSPLKRHLMLSDQVFGYVRYDTKRGKNLIENEGWAGLTFTF